MKEAVKEFIEHAKGHSKDEVILEIKDLKKNFVNGDIVVEVLKDIDLVVKKGEFISLMGESGSGKSTLLYQIGCLDDPTSGSVLINGVDIHKMKDDDKSKMRRETMGFVFQFYNLIPNLSVEENILLPVVMDGKNPKDYEAKLVEILEIVGLSDKRKALPRQLSGGQQQRVSIARAVIMSPSLLLADEPTGNLDSVSTKEVMELFTKLNKEKGITIIQVTHSHETAKYGNRIVKLKDGIVSN
jgi:putative ABC transport system ATP-binding protein